VGNPDVRIVCNMLQDVWGCYFWHVSGYGPMAGVEAVGSPDVDKVRSGNNMLDDNRDCCYFWRVSGYGPTATL
jgi:hypothetical protein